MKRWAWSILALAGCSGADDYGDTAGYEADYGYAGADGAGGDGGGDGSGGGADGAGGDGSWDTGEPVDDGFESEAEAPPLALAPASTPEHLFIANTSRGTLTRITLPGLDIDTVAVGEVPERVATTPDSSIAVVHATGSDELSIVRTDSLEAEHISVRDHLNALTLSPDSRWAAVYYDRDGEAVTGGDSTRSTNELSLVDLEAGVAHYLVVTSDARDLQFTPDSSRAVVMSDTWLSIVDLGADGPEVRNVEFTTLTSDAPPAEELLLSSDGRYALIRQFEAARLLLVDLDSGAVEPVEVGLHPTDLDLMPDGQHAVAVCRMSGELWIYDMADPLAAAEVVPLPTDVIFGSVDIAPTGDQALLYSTATGERVYGLWDLLDNSVTTFVLEKPIYSVTMSPSGNSALIFHTETDSEDMDEDSSFSGAWALTVLDMGDQFPHPLRLNARPLEAAMTEDGEWGSFILEGWEAVEIVDNSSLLVTEVELATQAERVGILPGTHTIWVNQVHELGQLSFYDPDSGDLRTMTGFELNEGIEH